MTHWTLIALAAAGMTGTAATDAQPDALRDVVRPAAYAKAAFDRPVTVETIETQGKHSKRNVMRYDPTSPDGRQWTLVSVDGTAATPAATARFAAALAKHQPPQTYADVDKYLATNPTAAGPDADGLLFRQDDLGARTIVVNGEDVSPSFRSTVHVSTTGAARFVDWIEFTAKQPFAIGPAVVSSAKGRIAFRADTQGGPPRATSTGFEASMKLPFGTTTISKQEVLHD